MRMRRDNAAEPGRTCSAATRNCANGGMFPDRTGPSDPRMAAIRSRLSHSASLLTPPRNYPTTQPVPGSSQSRRENFAGTAAPFTCGHSGFSVGAAVQSPSFYRERLDIFRPRQRSRSASVPRKSRNMKKKAKIWDHHFFCLASKTQCSPPGPIDRGHLMQAGLGGKSLSFMETSDAEMFHEDLLDAFPKLHTGGGYELLRTNERNSRSLDVIPPPPSGYTVEYLKSVAGQAKIYIRPLQKDLDLAPAEGEGTVSVIYTLCSAFMGGPIPQ